MDVQGNGRRDAGQRKHDVRVSVWDRHTTLGWIAYGMSVAIIWVGIFIVIGIIARIVWVLLSGGWEMAGG